MIPAFVDIKSVWKVLPPGIHIATLEEIEERFAYNDKRSNLFQGFKKGLVSLKLADCKAVYLDGSFISDKDFPSDFDACWDPTGVDEAKLDPMLITHNEDEQRLQKQVFGGEFFVSTPDAKGSSRMLDFFKMDKNGKEKGIICIQLGEELTL